MKKSAVAVKEVTFDEVITFIHKCEDVDTLKAIEKVLNGAVVYAVNIVPDPDIDSWKF